jgi:hypothetical protein
MNFARHLVFALNHIGRMTFSLRRIVLRILASSLLVLTSTGVVVMAAAPANTGWSSSECIGINNKCAPAPASAPGVYGSYPKSTNPANFHPGHYIFVGENDGKYQFDLIKNNPDFVGVKKNYPWIKLETAEDVYDFSQIEADLKYLQSIGKRLWLQVNDTQFGPWNPLTPSYMWKDSKYGCDPAFYGNYKRSVQDGGWLPCIWNDNVMSRITALYNALGARFNGEAYIEAITIGETSTGSTGWGYNPSVEQAAFKVRALAGKRAFPNKTVSHSVNFASFDLNPFVQWLAANGIGINHPDAIFAPWKGLVTDVFPFSIQHHADVPNSMDVSGFSYTEYNSNIGRANTSAELLSGVVQYTNPHYILWDITNPYFTNDVVPAIRNYGPLPAARDFYNYQK